MFERVLLATDGSSHAEAALKWARHLARRDHAQVVVVHAFVPVPSYLGEPQEDWAIPRPLRLRNTQVRCTFTMRCTASTYPSAWQLKPSCRSFPIHSPTQHKITGETVASLPCSSSTCCAAQQRDHPIIADPSPRKQSSPSRCCRRRPRAPGRTRLQSD